MRRLSLMVLILFAGLLPAADAEPYALVIVRGGSGVVSVPVDLAELGKACGVASTTAPFVAQETPAGLVALHSQFDVPPNVASGLLSFFLSEHLPEARVRVYLTEAHPKLPAPTKAGLLSVEGRFVIRGHGFVATHDPTRASGLPSLQIAGKTINATFADRLHDPATGSFLLREDRGATVQFLTQGPLLTRVIVHAHYTQNGKRPPSEPEATYVFTYTAGSPLVRVDATISQREPFAWNELHLLELDFRESTFADWATGEPWSTGKLKGDKKSYRGNQWAALSDGKIGVGVLSGETNSVYDGDRDYMYVHGPWVHWAEKDRQMSASLWLGSAESADQVFRGIQESAKHAGAPEVIVTLPQLESQREKIKQLISALPRGQRRGRFAWALDQLQRMGEHLPLKLTMHASAEMLSALEKGGDAAEAFPWLNAMRSGPGTKLIFPGPVMLENGRVGIGISQQKGSAIALTSVYDFDSETEMIAQNAAPLWRIELQDADGKTQTITPADCSGSLKKSDDKLTLQWHHAVDIKCEVKLDGPRATWSFNVDNESKSWSISRVTFPQVSLGQIGCACTDDKFVYPHVSGQLVDAPLTKPFRYTGTYPSCNGTLQFFAHYDEHCGIYLAAHDPLACTKELCAEHAFGSPLPREGEGLGVRGLNCSFIIPAENIGVPGNRFRLSGQSVMEVFHGDWFDAAQIYKRWVETEAKWRPDQNRDRKGADLKERTDTPQWMRDLPLWAITGGDAQHVVKVMKEFREYMGVPVGVHWYTWHQIPFDNSYPHYFPAKPGFPEGVRELQAAGVRVMPYINGRLWDTGLDDFKETAITAATKDAKGKAYIEEYGSGRKLAPMCPVTPLWQKTVQDIVLRLLGPEGGVDGVYIDQVAAAAPCLCFDKSHGHPLGGGHWWTTDGYWKMLSSLRSEMKSRFPDRMLTTECNAEPYARFFDAYLTWNFQYQDQIPLFSAVYGGKLLMFGRAYRGGPTKDLALRMKAAQSLVYGEQIGWCDPSVIKEPVGGPFMRRMARLRYALRDYLSAGEMAHPPKLRGEIPTVTADWQWSGTWNVTDTEIQTGAWHARDGRLALIFVSVTDKELSTELDFSAERYGFKPGAKLSVSVRTEDGAQPATEQPASFRRKLVLPPYQAIVLEVKVGP
ncbi:MAG TPA: DUF6259 domain-containing protein [Planctomycetota bacterium]|jgi:hypothetical protein